MGTNAFYGCNNVESIDIPKTLTEIKGNLFNGEQGKVSEFKLHDINFYWNIEEVKNINLNNWVSPFKYYEDVVLNLVIHLNPSDYINEKYVAVLNAYKTKVIDSYVKQYSFSVVTTSLPVTIGIYVGITLSILLIVGLLVLAYWQIRKHNKKNKPKKLKAKK